MLAHSPVIIICGILGCHSLQHDAFVDPTPSKLLLVYGLQQMQRNSRPNMPYPISPHDSSYTPIVPIHLTAPTVQPIIRAPPNPPKERSAPWHPRICHIHMSLSHPQLFNQSNHIRILSYYVDLAENSHGLPTTERLDRKALKVSCMSWNHVVCTSSSTYPSYES